MVFHLEKATANKKQEREILKMKHEKVEAWRRGASTSATSTSFSNVPRQVIEILDDPSSAEKMYTTTDFLSLCLSVSYPYPCVIMCPTPTFVSYPCVLPNPQDCPIVSYRLSLSPTMSYCLTSVSYCRTQISYCRSRR